VLAIAVIVLAASAQAVLIGRYFQGQDSYDSLVEEVESVELTLSRFQDIEELRMELSAAEAQLEAARSIIPARQSNTLSIESLLALSETASLDVSDVTTQVGDRVNIGEQSYSAVTIHLRVSGTLDELIAFLGTLEGGALASARVDELNIIEVKQSADSGLQDSDGIDNNPYTQINLTADMSISILTRA
jgi:hypothetical protein